MSERFPGEFEDLAEKIVDAVATDGERARFVEMLKEDESLRGRYAELMRIHALLCCHGGRSGVRAARTGRFAEAAASAAGLPAETSKCAPPAPAPLFEAGLTPAEEGRPRRAVPAKRDTFARLVAPPKWRKAAAAAAVLLGGALVWRGVPLISGLRPPTSDLRSPISDSPVRVVRQWGASRLELPDELPGALRLGNGRAVVRLESGVELTLLGPLEAEVRDAMQVRLESGRLLAEVPPVASGFTVLTAELEIYDLGTVFGVSAEGRNSGVFVFKGSVQVNEASGDAVGLCEAGGGVRAAAGLRPLQVAADWPEAQKVFAAVRGTAALADPSAAFDAADRVTALWTKRYMPTVVPPPPPPVAGMRGTAIGKGQSAGVGTVPRTVRGRLGEASLPGISNHTTTVARKTAPAQNEEDAMRMTNTAAAVAAAVAMGAGAAWAVPAVSNVQMTQRAGSRVVDITYDLAGEAAIVTLGIETNGVAIPDSAVTRLSGDVSVVIQPGTGRSIVWNAGADWPENVTETAKARVTAWSVDAPPLYCAVDVVGGPATNSYPVYYYAGAEAVPEGVTNGLYKTTRILMRRLPATGAGGFKMGSPSNETGRDAAREYWHDVVLTKAFYAGVYEVTQSQWQQVMGDVRSWPAKWSNNDYKLTRPVEQVSYYDIRENWTAGSTTSGGSAIDPHWPQSDAVGAVSFMGRLRTKTGLAGFDLPTDAQWEYACRAGTSGALNDGTVNLTNTTSDARLDLLGRYQYDGGKVWSGTAWVDPATDCTAANATATVGSYAPNAWGLYDTHGNVWEWCLDWYAGNLGTAPAEDPAGAVSGSHRVSRGGRWSYTASYCRSAFRYYSDPSYRDNSFGFRLVRTLP